MVEYKTPNRHKTDEWVWNTAEAVDLEMSVTEMSFLLDVNINSVLFPGWWTKEDFLLCDSGETLLWLKDGNKRKSEDALEHCLCSHIGKLQTEHSSGAAPSLGALSSLSPPSPLAFHGAGLLHTWGIPAGCGKQQQSPSSSSALRQHKGQNKHEFV